MAQCPDDWPKVFAKYWWEGAELLSYDASDDERAGRDSLGIPGRIRERRAVAIVRERRTHAVARRALEDAGLRVLVSDSERAEMDRPRAVETAEMADPFLLEDRVSATVRGRSFPGQQRAMIEAKCDALKRELADLAVVAKRRVAAAAMLHGLEEGLATIVELRAIERRFVPQVPLPQPRDAMGTVLPICRGARLVYRVNSVDADFHRHGGNGFAMMKGKSP